MNIVYGGSFNPPTRAHKFIIDRLFTIFRPDNIIATVSSKGSSRIDLYVTGIDTPFHVHVADEESAREIMDYVWERPDPEHIDCGE